MKDATGELSMTAIAVVAIAAIGVVFTQLVWPAIKRNITRSAHCSEAYNCVCSKSAGSLCDCKYLDEDDSSHSIQCPDQSSDNKSGAKSKKG